ncbi:Asx homology domain-containing protein [Podospora aff. communis PSN243]|uniref:Asx homology domain-containing protein n=1 Tax=Podospora aff. communis PSN243 TaxID=3040156 RepID=A0AAV9GWF8_9PEZI|nr:Asx homology domain-containing protein [Podospora aff. communis PSN243]
MPEAASSSSLSSSPVTNNEGRGSQDVFVTDSTLDPEWPHLRGGAPKSKATKKTAKKKASEDVDEDEQVEDDGGSNPAPARRNAKRKAEDLGEGASSANAPRKRGKPTQSEVPGEGSSGSDPSKRGKTTQTEDAGEGSSAIVPKKRAKTTQAARWNAPGVFTNKNSPLTKTNGKDLMAMLLQPAAWDILTEAEKAEILALFPDNGSISGAGTAKARPNTQALKSNIVFRADCDKYVENIKEGLYKKQWLQGAWEAHAKHNRGEYHTMIAKSFRKHWGEDMPARTYPADAGHAVEGYGAEDDGAEGGRGEGSSRPRKRPRP